MKRILGVAPGTQTPCFHVWKDTFNDLAKIWSTEYARCIDAFTMSSVLVINLVFWQRRVIFAFFQVTANPKQVKYH